MIVFEVKDMSCGHCVKSITQAVQALDRDAQVRVDLAAQRVEIDSASSDAEAVRAAIAGAGYTPQPV